MRVKITNQSSHPDATIIPLVEYAATFFPHRTGTVWVTIKNTRKGWYGHRMRGVCYGSCRCTIWVAPLGQGRSYPCEFDQMHYFRHANHESVKTLTANSWQEYCLSIIAHEMEHTTKGNRAMRRSKQEVYAWNRGVEVVEASRTNEGQAFLQQRHRELSQVEAHIQERAAFKKSPESKRERCEVLLKKWQKKEKAAQTRIRKLKSRIRYFEKREKMAASKAAMA